MADTLFDKWLDILLDKVFKVLPGENVWLH